MSDFPLKKVSDFGYNALLFCYSCFGFFFIFLEVSKKLSAQIIRVIANRGSVLKSLFAAAFAQEHNEQLMVKKIGFNNILTLFSCVNFFF